ncbi:MAG: ribosome small subunit-dependent GTPase A [Lachnospiraceae bacterium]|nr:ribosome small subunit-dependent GTPase A [Lachnospiraceae bacterium]
MEEIKTGRIIKGISGFYYVYVAKSGIYECKAKGGFRKEGIKPLVGDIADIRVISEADKTGNVEHIHERTSELLRPPVANVDQALVIFALKKPKPNLGLLDRFLVNMEYRDLPVVICFNKTDLVSEEEAKSYKDIYESSGYKVIFSSTKEKKGLDEIKACLEGKLSTVAGPSGVGKSSIINELQSNVVMDTDDIMKKMDSGKQTTRHSQLIALNDHSYIMDTPGFGSMYLPEIECEELDELFPEMRAGRLECKFSGCAHIHEPSCGVKEDLKKGIINSSRYENYKAFYEEIKSGKKY